MSFNVCPLLHNVANLAEVSQLKAFSQRPGEHYLQNINVNKQLTSAKLASLCNSEKTIGILGNNDLSSAQSVFWLS